MRKTIIIMSNLTIAKLKIMKSTDNIRFYLKRKGISNKDFLSSINKSGGYLNSTSDFSPELLRDIARLYPDLNIEWLVTGKGEMIAEKGDKSGKMGIPYYEKLPVAAGKREMVHADEIPTGYINLPGIAGKYCFPIVGCSMEPEIRAGEIVVADDVNSWERLDPDKVYLIITHEDRMIKHLEIDGENEEILWCVSPNYKRFSIRKEDVVKIYKITFHGRLI